MKKLLLVAILLCAYMHAAADTALDDYGMEWDYTLYDAVGGKIATDVRPHDMSTVTGSVTVPATLRGYEVKSLQVGAFIHCTALTSVSFECGIEEISSNAFYGCTSLGRVSIPSSVNAINSGAFSGCYNLSSITIPSNVTSISSTAFEGCTWLTSVTINSNFIMCNYDSSKSLKDVFGSQVLHYYIGRNVTKIGACAFYGCSRMSSVEINSSIEEIGFKAFYNCSNLTSITIPSSIKEIGDDAFAGCSNLMTVSIASKDILSNRSAKEIFGSQVTQYNIGNNVTSIGSTAFNDCKGLRSIVIPTSVTSIASGAFSGCVNLTDVTINSNDFMSGSYSSSYSFKDIFGNQVTQYSMGPYVKSIGSSAFWGCSGITRINIPSSVASIGSMAFYGCSSLTTIEIPKSVTIIDRQVFDGCSSLASIYLHPMIQSIGDYAFRGCNSLNSIDLPPSIMGIGSGAFSDCSGMKSFAINSKVPIAVTDNILEYNYRTHVTLFVLPGCADAYRTADVWKDFGNICDTYAYFEDQTVKALCLANWDANGDGILTLDEISVVSSLRNVFNGHTEITAFDELQYFAGLTSIGNSAFSGCTNLASLVVPNSVKSIGSSAFEGCVRLTSVNLPSSVTNIDSDAFSGCSSLTSVLIPSNITTIGSNAFKGCSGLKKVIVPNIPAWCNITFYNEAANPLFFAEHLYSDEDTEIRNLVIPNSVTKICGSAFYNCSGLTSVLVPSNIITIGSNAFKGCSGLKKVIVPDIASWCSVTFENSYANPLFLAHHLYSDENTEITRLEIPESVTNISSWAFDNTVLTYISIPNSVKSIGDYAFFGSYPEQIAVNWQTPITVNSNVFDMAKTTLFVPIGCRDAYAAAEIWKSFKTIVEYTGTNRTITFADDNVKALCVQNWDFDGDGELSKEEAASVTDLGDVFKATGITSFEELQYFTRLKELPGGTFMNSSMTKVIIPSSVTIVRNAFWGCGRLTSVVIPKSVTSIETTAFYQCNNLSSVTVEWKEPLTINQVLFTNRANATLYVPVGCKAAYEVADYWKEFKNIIEYVIPITFADTNVKALCIENWDTNGDGELDEDEAAAITNLNDVFKGNQEIILFDELCFFTGLTSIDHEVFSNCSNLISLTIPNSVTTIGTNAFYECSGLTSVTIPNSVTSIGEGAFRGCKRLSSLYIPNSVTSIGDYAFQECTGLSSFTMPDGVSNIGEGMFHDCTNLISVVIPKSVKIIGNSAFAGCSNLTSIIIPRSVTNVGHNVLQDCSNLTSVKVEWEFPVTITSDFFPNCANAILYVPVGCKNAYESAECWKDFKEIVEIILFADNNVKSLCITNWDFNSDDELSLEEVSALTDLGSVFKGNKDIVSFDELKFFTGLTNISEEAFKECSNLMSISIPPNVTNIDLFAFEECGFTSFNIHNNVKVIDIGAFRKCRGLTSITIPSSVTSIGSYAFSGCSGLSSITIPSSVTFIGSSAFENCSSLESIAVEIGNSAYDSRNNCNAIIETRSNALIQGCKNTIIPSGVTSIGSYAFSGCSGLSSITIPNSVTSIGKEAFRSCYSLSSITIPNSVTSIGKEAFRSCYSLSSITIPNSVTSIGNSAFKYCDGLTSVVIPYGITSIGSAVFSACGSLTSVTIPSSVISIDSSAFEDCWNLTSVRVEIEKPITIDLYVFPNRANATLYVPYGCKDAYQAADYWKGFKEIVEMDPSSPAITFADANVKAICVANWDTNGDGELSKDEAAAVTSLGTVFEDNTEITSFDEISYFTGLKKIESSAFSGCSSLTSVVLPGSVSSIDVAAFSGCQSLTSITIPKSVTSVDNRFALYCTGLSSIQVEEGNPRYDSRNNCNALIETETNTLLVGCKKTVIPSSITAIGDYAFQYCVGLTSLTIPDGVTTIGKHAFQYCVGLAWVTIPKSVSSIGTMAFLSCTSLKAVHIQHPAPIVVYSNPFPTRAAISLYVPIGSKAAYEAADYWKEFGAIVEYRNITFADANVKEICVANWDTNGDGELSEDEAAAVTSLGTVFKGNAEITSFDEISYFTGLTGFEDDAFNGCSGLTSFTIPSNITSIGRRAFYNCSGLTTITIPESVTDIYNHVFSYCTGITSITVESENSVYDSRNDCNAIIKTKTNQLVRGCKNTVIPDNVTRIGLYSFMGCTGLTSIIIPESVTAIAASAFHDCTDLASVVIPNSVTSIESAAFRHCNSLTSVTVEMSTPLEINENVFSNRTNATLYVPAGSKAAYEAADYWKEFKNIVEMENEQGEITLDKTEVAIEKGQIEVLTATCPSSWTDQSVTWESSDPTIVIVKKGKIKGMKVGTATITCTSVATGQSATCEVTVGYVKLSKYEVTIQKGEILTLKSKVYPTTLDQSVTWESSDPTIVIVKKGKIKGMKAGTATITCTSNVTGLSATCEVTVGYVKLNKTEVTIQKGEILTLKSKVYPTTLDQSVIWESSNPKIVKVKAGKIGGINVGTATITCTSVATGLSTTCVVTVTAAASARSLDDETTGIDVNSVVAETFDVYDLNGRKVLHQATSLDALPNGVYIVNGKKIVK